VSKIVEIFQRWGGHAGWHP